MGFSVPVLSPVLGEVGFTVFFCAPSDIHAGSHLVFVKPSGAVLDTNPSLNYVVSLPDLQPFNYPIVSYTFGPGEIDEVGIWQVMMESEFDTSLPLPMAVYAL